MQTEKALPQKRARVALRSLSKISAATLLAAALVALPGTAKAGGTVVRSTPGVAKPSNQVIEQTRRDFYKLGLRMIGTSKLIGETSVMLSQPGWKDQKPHRAGDTIGGFKIVSIQSGYTIFERGGVHLWLAIGDETAPTQADLKQAAKDLAVGKTSGSIQHADIKQAAKDLAAVNSIASKRANRFIKQAPNGLPKYTIPENEDVTEEDIDIADLHSGGDDWVPDVKSMDPTLKTAFPRASQQNGRFSMPAIGRLGSPFGYRKHPMGGGRKYHRGVDLEIPSGTAVKASAGGTVINVARNWAKGVYVEIDHGNGFTTHYFHLSSVNVRAGQVVKQGQMIASSGSTGMSTGPHLHFEIHKGAIPVDPALYVKEIGQ